MQHGLRINEKINLSIGEGKIHGSGKDMDGEFVLDGDFDAEGRVKLIRRYTVAIDRRTGRPKADFMAVLVLYDYFGQWDGEMISGIWEIAMTGDDGGEFEMWPYREEDRLEISFEADTRTEEKPFALPGIPS